MRGTELRASWVATSVVTLLALTAPVAAHSTTPPPTPGPSAPLVAAPFTTKDDLPDPRLRMAPTPEVAERPDPHLLVSVPRPLPAHARPTRTSPVIGSVTSRSKYYGVSLVAWVEAVSRDGRWGRVELPYTWPRRDGWIRLAGLHEVTTRFSVRVDISAHRVTVSRDDQRLFTFPGATGAAASPTPPGDYFVTDRVPFSAGSSLGSFAFGISGIQPHLPAGWSGGNQLAIHGTNAPWTIGTSASAGCIRVSEAALARLRPLLRLGTPVVIVP